MPYQLTKFQAPSSNTFRDILLTILKWPNFQRAVNLEKYGDHFFLIWSGNLLIIPYQLTKFQAPSSNKFWDMLLTSLKCPNLQKAITPEKQVAQRATITHLSPMCQGQMWSFSNKSMGTFCFRDIQVQKRETIVTQGQVTQKWVVWFGQKSNSTEHLCQVWLFPIYGKFFRRSRATNSIVSGPIWPKFELAPDFMHVLITCKYEKDHIKSNRQMVKTPFSPL